MQILETNYYTEIKGVDDNGEFLVRIQKDCSQLYIETADGDAFIGVNYRELKIIRDAITEVLDGFGQSHA